MIRSLDLAESGPRDDHNTSGLEQLEAVHSIGLHPLRMSFLDSLSGQVDRGEGYNANEMIRGTQK